MFTKRRLPAAVTLQEHILCCDTPRAVIMFNTHTTSASVSASVLSSVKGPSFSPSRKPSVSRHLTSPRLLTYQSRSPSTRGAQQIPWSGQSCTRPVGSFSLESCQRNVPSVTSKAMRQPRSTFAGYRSIHPLPLLVPTKTFPSEITGLP